MIVLGIWLLPNGISTELGVQVRAMACSASYAQRVTLPQGSSIGAQCVRHGNKPLVPRALSRVPLFPILNYDLRAHCS